MVRVEIGMALSDNEDGDDAAQQTQPPPLAPVKCESESQPAAGAAFNDDGGDYCNNNGHGDEGMKPATTGGKGLWSLWTRNFKSTLLMLLDLVDNSVDATMQRGETTSDQSFAGHIEIYRDLYEEVLPKKQTCTTGLCIRNNSPKKITPMGDVLKLFISSKDSGSDSIGENGVGLKQSCAALSDLSFVLVKNGSNKFELGILAKALQRDDGCYLPCFEFNEGDGGRTVGQQMMDIFCKPNYKEVAACISCYGQVGQLSEPSLSRGVARLSKHFDDINTKFRGNSYVFEVIIDKVVYQGASKFSTTQGKNAAVTGIIAELQHEIPRRYLHIPDKRFKFCIGKKELAFKYWPERLVEFTKIEIPVRSETPWHEDFGEITDDSYVLQVFLGFDRYRILDFEQGICSSKACSLYIYSRSSGRLVQYEKDARTMLGLTAGGTDFCQALTVIIDDIGGHLPLDPTKQGVAFGHHANGHVHQQNLYSVVNGVVKFYYKYHLKKFGDSKAVLTAKISEFSEADIPDKLKTCRNSILTDYGVLFNITKDNRIVVDRTCQVGYEIGPDTIFRLASPDLQNKCRKVAPPQKSAHSPAKKKSSLSKKRTTTKVIPVSSKRNQPSPSKKRSIKKVKPLSRKKCQVAIDKAKDSPPRLKGKRSSTRQRRSPEWWSVESGNYGNSETENEESDDADSETENDESDDAVNAAHSPPQLKGGRPSMKTRRKSNGHRGDGRKEAETVQEVIDICSSSDEEDDLMTKDVPMPDCVASNVSAIESAKMPGNASSSALVNNSEENNIAEELETDEENDTETNLDFVAKSLEIENLNAKVLSLQNEKESLQNENKSLQNENESLQNENESLQNKNVSLQNENESLQNELMGLRQELEQRKLFAL